MLGRQAQLLLLLVFWPSVLLAELVNVTVDDSAAGPDANQAVISYSPTDGWQDALECTACKAVPDTSGVLNGTFHHTTADTLNTNRTGPTFFTFNFKGTGIYVYGVLANNLGTNVGTKADYTFTLDNQDVGRFIHNPDPTASNYQYNVPFYANGSVPDGQHTLVVTVNGGAGIQGSSLMLLDYITYTFDDGTTISSSNPFPSLPSNTSLSSPPLSTSTSKSKESNSNLGAIIGGSVVGTLFLISMILLGVWYMRRRVRRAATSIYGKPDPFLIDRSTTNLFQPLLISKSNSSSLSPSPSSLPVHSKRRPSEFSSSPYAPNISSYSSRQGQDAEIVEVENRLREMEQAIANLSNNGGLIPPSTPGASMSSPSTQSNFVLQKQVQALQNQLTGLREQQRVLIAESRPPQYQA